MKKFWAFLFFAPLALGAVERNFVTESRSSYVVKAEAPIPKEINDELEAHKLAREAAVTWGQNEILKYVLKKKAKSGRILAVAEIPSLELQKELRDYVKTAKVEGVEFTNKICKLSLTLPKAPLKAILKKN